MATLADREIASLDDSLAQYGEDVTLRRTVGSDSQMNVDVTCRAFVREYDPALLTETIIQGDSKVIISSSEIVAAGWPGGAPVGSTIDERVPRKNDKVVIAGKPRNVEAAAPIYLSGQLVRIDIQVRG